MPETTIATFSIRRLEILDPDGNVDASLLPPLDHDQLRRIYELLILSRTFDQRALSLQREGRIGTYPSILGQEAAQVGSAFAVTPDDWVFPSFREMGAHFTLGYPMDLLIRYWAGDERGMHTPPGLNIFPICVSVGTHIPHAVGAAMALRLKGEKGAVVAYFGDGATSKGDFHEGFNMAGVYRLPLVFICQNNQWAISVPLQGQTAAATLAQKAVAYGFEGVQVDGNDVLAVYRAAREALEKARSGGGPTFIECLTYRMGDHTTADDAGRYRPVEELAAWQGRDPIRRLERYLATLGLWDEAYGKEVREKSGAIVDAAVVKAEAASPPEPQDMFDALCAEPGQRQQRKQV